MIGRIAFGIVWTGIACEMFLRLLAPQALMPRAVTYSEMGIRVNTPGATYWQRSPEVTVRVHINSQGMRADEDFPLNKPPGVKRIVLLGDSFGLGAEVDLQHTFASVMADRLGGAGVPTQVINLSVAGYGTAEELIALRERGFSYHPDLVLLAWHPTDVADNVNSRLFSLKDGVLIRDQASYYPGLKTRKRLERIPGYRWLDANSHLYIFLRQFVTSKILDNHGEDPIDTPAAAAAPAPTAEEKLAVALLQQMESDCRTRGIPLLILDVPSRRSRTQFQSKFPRHAMEDRSPLDIVSPLEAFRKHEGEKLFWEHGNFHFSTLGSRIVGELLADHVIKEGLLTRRHAEVLRSIR